MSELSLQISTLVSQVSALSTVPLLPPWNQRTRVKSLYYQGFGMHAYGWSCRPWLPNQLQVQDAMAKLRAIRPHATNWGWLPIEIFGDLADGDFPLGVGSWRVRQLHLQAGLKEARRLRRG